MKTIAVTPASAAKRAAKLAEVAGWTLEPYYERGVEDALLDIREPLLVIPPHARVPRSLDRIVVVHEGSPLVTPAMEMADEVALVSGAEIVVLHVISAKPPKAPGSLPSPRFADSLSYAWEEWRLEFLRRFCKMSKGLSVSLEVTSGDPVEAIPLTLIRIHPSLVVATWKGKADPDRSRILRMLVSDSRCPVLVLRERPTSS